MRPKKAYSLELKESITSEEADKKFEQGYIQSKFDFRCPDENCTAQVTCANLDKPKHLRKIKPYYKVSGKQKHSIDCQIAKNEPVTHSKTDRSLSSKITFPPSSTKKDTVEGVDPVGDDEHSDDTDVHKAKRATKNTQPEKTFSSLIDAFLANKSEEIELFNTKIPESKDAFIKIDGQRISDLPDGHIYYGEADFNERDEDYLVRFKSTLIADELVIEPTFFVTKKDLDSLKLVKFSQETMARVAKNTRKKTVYLFCKKAPSLNHNKKYINFNGKCDKEDRARFMEYRLQS